MLRDPNAQTYFGAATSPLHAPDLGPLLAAVKTATPLSAIEPNFA
jgi:hypothetical protein